MSFIGLNASAQDVIVKRNGEELQCKILEVSKKEVKYKRWTNQEGPAFAEKKSDIFMIKYENGEKEVVAYESPVLETPVVAPSLSTANSSNFTLADPTPISNVYLEYTSRGKRKSGIIKWGHMQSDEQAQSLLTNDWLDYKKARKDERTGKVLAITGGSLFLGGLWWTVYYIVCNKEYLDAKNEYEKMAPELNEKYTTAKSEYYRLKRQLYPFDDDYYEILAAYTNAQSDMSYARNKLCDLEEDMDGRREYRNETLCPMLGGLTTGSALLIVGIIKAKRGHKNATQIVNKYNDEYEKSSKKTSMSKPEFNIGSKGNNLAFTLTF